MRDSSRLVGLAGFLGAGLTSSGCGSDWIITSAPLFADKTIVEECASLSRISDYEDICAVFADGEQVAEDNCNYGFLASQNRVDQFIDRELAEGEYEVFPIISETEILTGTGYSSVEGSLVSLAENQSVDLVKKNVVIGQHYEETFLTCSYAWLEGENVCDEGLYSSSTKIGMGVEYNGEELHEIVDVLSGIGISLKSNVLYDVEWDCFRIYAGANLEVENDSGETTFSNTRIGEFDSLDAAETLTVDFVDSVHDYHELFDSYVISGSDTGNYE